MIIVNPYETLALRNHVTNKVVSALDAAKYSEQLKSEESPKSEHTAYIDAESQVESFSVEVPQWGHPIKVNDKWIIDQRPATKYNMLNRKVMISNISDYNFNKIRNYLTASFDNDYARDYLRNISSLPMSVYASWISESLGRRLSLDAGTEFTINIISAIAYQCYFLKEGEWSEDVKKQMAIRINRDMRINSEHVFAVLDQLDSDIRGIDGLCANIVNITGNVRLEKLNAALLFTLIGGSWLGFNAREVACVALEHVPTFLAMLYISLAERGFNAATFSKLAQRKGKQDHGEFIKKINSMTLTFN